MITKKQLLERIESMPEESFDSKDIVLERLILIDKIQQGLDDIENGRVYTMEEVKKRIEKW